MSHSYIWHRQQWIGFVIMIVFVFVFTIVGTHYELQNKELQNKTQTHGDKMKIYLAVPYSSESKAVMIERFEAVTLKTGELMNDGHIVYSPITACHPVAERCELPGSWDYWKELDYTFIKWADEVWIYTLDGWKESKGVTAEIEIAKLLNKPIKYIEERKND